MWILGGIEKYYFGGESSLLNDVWNSSDGVHWQLVTRHAPWAPRAYHSAVALDGKLWVFAGGNYLPKYEAHNDVWNSPDGVNWTRVTQKAPWTARIWSSAVVYKEQMWILGGWSNNPSRNWGDVWHSKDGKNWERLQSKVTWKERHEHSVFVFKDKLWIAGGHAKPLSSEVWSLHLPAGWKP